MFDIMVENVMFPFRKC